MRSSRVFGSMTPSSKPERASGGTLSVSVTSRDSSTGVVKAGVVKPFEGFVVRRLPPHPASRSNAAKDERSLIRADIPAFQGDKGRSASGLARLRSLPFLMHRRRKPAAEFERPELKRAWLTKVLRRNSGNKRPSHPSEQRPLAGDPGRDRGNRKAGTKRTRSRKNPVRTQEFTCSLVPFFPVLNKCAATVRRS